MGYEHKDMSGSLFNNDDRPSERSPHLTGKCKIEGRDLRVIGWHSERRPGMITLQFEDWDEYKQKTESRRRDDANAVPGSTPTPQGDFDTPVPF